MTDNSNTTGKLVWTGLRQMQALRDALSWSLGGKAVKEPEVAEWLSEQGFPTTPVGGGQSLVGLIASVMDQHRLHLLGDAAYAACVQEQRSSHLDTDDVGTDRSSAGWENAANFLITSAFVRLLGAWEQYELDVLKALVHYRPTGEALGPPAEQTFIKPDLSVVHEEPIPDNLLFCTSRDLAEDLARALDDKTVTDELRRLFSENGVPLTADAKVSAKDQGREWRLTSQRQTHLIQKSDDSLRVYRGSQPSTGKIYRKTRMWTWVGKHVENSSERARILSTVYQIKTIPGVGEDRTKHNKQRNEWYDKRNKIAHGRAEVMMPLVEYLEADVLVCRSIMFVADQCRKQHNLLV